MTDRENICAIEAILFASGSSVSIDKIMSALDIKKAQALEYMRVLEEEYNSEKRGLEIIRLNDSYQMVTKKAYAPQIRTVMDLKRNTPLSQAALEVLAVVAYNQPVTKAFIEQVRGVDCSGVLSSLAAKDLVEERGRLELPGRPLLYGTTENFLRCFGLSSLEDLPSLPEKEEEKEEPLTGEELSALAGEARNILSMDTADND